MTKFKAISAAIVLAGAFTGLMAGAQPAPAPLPAVATKPASTAGSPVADLDAALSTASWARANKSPEGLALASRMLASVPVKPMEKQTKETELKADPAGASAKKPAEVTPESLLAEAKTLAGSDKDALAAVDRIAKTPAAARGNASGAYLHYDVVRAGDTDSYRFTFVGGEVAQVAVSGDGTSDLDLYVYDENGNLVGSDTDYTDDCVVTLMVRRTGRFTVRVVNCGRVWNAYAIATN